MLKTFSKKVSDVNVVEGIVSNLPVFPVLDQVEIPEDTELVRNCRLGLPQQGGEVANAQLILGEGIKNLGPGRVAKNLECLGQLLDDPVRLHYFPDSINFLLVDA